MAVLVIEDEALVREHAVALLREAGCEVVEASDAERALAEIELDPNNITHVFADHHLAGQMSGLDLARVICEHWLHIRVVLTSGYPVDGDDVDLVAVRFLPKPWAAADVLKVVH